ncbi:MAG: Unknown protein [uncultured Sulfurovum sp.]|uniref:Outer membrane protein beta-barrel domain-containing protein n=1 Tax=uncultured Sulfurovum sp. TaxID=269237 RepID=A0A6S6UFL1_9BACT|nr:MAG: Unknown protein [uncultured Sulfurovum sp.]
MGLFNKRLPSHYKDYILKEYNMFTPMQKAIFSTLIFSTLTYANTSDAGYIDHNATNNQSSHFYAGLALSAVSARESGASQGFTSENDGQDRLGNVTLLAGYNIHTNVAIEGRYSTTFTQEDVSEMSSLSIFLKPQYALSEELSVYGLLGFGKVSLDNATAHSNVDVDESGFQWGLGASYAATEELSIFIDYTSLANDVEGTYLNANAADVSAVTVGVSYKF